PYTTLFRSKGLFGAARAVPEGGSLTVIATALIETESRMDDVIFEEFKGTGNAELRLSRALADRRLYPAVDVAASGTRREELLGDAATVAAKQQIRRGLGELPPEKANDVLLAQLKRSKTHAELLAAARLDAQLTVGGRDAVERRTEIGVFPPDHRDGVLRVAADHVAVQVGDDVRQRHGRMVGPVPTSPQPALFAAHGHEDQRALGSV